MIHFILGTKAQLIKTAPVMLSLKEEGIEYNYIFTGQHKETMADIEANFQIKKPDYTIYDGTEIVSKIKMLFWIITSIIHVIKNKKKIFKNDKFGIVLVHGDTVSTVLGAFLGKICGYKVGHIESGLRSHNIWQPFPEELCRLITFRLSYYYFCPGEWALNNLTHHTGIKINTKINTLYDSLMLSRGANISTEEVHIPTHKYGIVTLHRFENLRNKEELNRIIQLLTAISLSEKIIFILHKPTEIKLKEYGLFHSLENNSNIELRKRYSYFSFMKLLHNADFVISDGGSNQEECFYLGKPLLLFRNVSERKEGIGKNAVISRFDDFVIKDFFNNIESFRHQPLEVDICPSKIIIGQLKAFL